ncbi:MAG: TolC family protein, partial [Gemmataceae bacterium]
MTGATKRNGRLLTRWCLLLPCALPLACTGLTTTGVKARSAGVPPALSEPASIQPVAYAEQQPAEQSTDALPKPRPAQDGENKEPTSSVPFAGMSVLSLDALVEQVLARNPTIAQMVAAWKAAEQRYPQVTSLEDPMFGGTIGPGTFGSPNVNFAYIVQMSQKIPFPGKRKLRGEAAQAEANAAGRDVDDIRLQLIESARLAFFNFYLVDRSLEVNQEGLRLMADFRKKAVDRYESGVKKPVIATRQDIDQADVEIGRLQERDLLLKRVRQVAIARINTLMHRLPDLPLPPAPVSLELRGELPDIHCLYDAAWVQRPDLRALAERIAADRAR